MICNESGMDYPKIDLICRGSDCVVARLGCVQVRPGGVPRGSRRVLAGPDRVSLVGGVFGGEASRGISVRTMRQRESTRRSRAAANTKRDCYETQRRQDAKNLQAAEKGTSRREMAARNAKIAERTPQDARPEPSVYVSLCALCVPCGNRFGEDYFLNPCGT
jgi:hypothetical protein